VDSAVEDERRNIAIEIHDQLNATLITARLDLLRIVELANEAPASSAIDEIKLKAESLIKLMLSLYSSARNLVRRLRPEVLELLGLRGAVEEIVRSYNDSQQNCRFEFQSTGDFSNLDSALAITAFRLIQEALSNIVKHSGASLASVSLFMNKGDRSLHLTIADDGHGFDPAQLGSGVGILGMRERVVAFGGRIDFRSTVGGGTKIEIALPIIESAA
jgi:two-component system sensor histidine kinase UhpB